MHEPARVGGREALRRLQEHVDDLLPAARAVAQPRAQAVALDELHRDEEPPLVVADLEHGHHVRVGQLRERVRLALQPRAVARRVALASQYFDRDVAPQRLVARDVDEPHPSGSERPHDREPPDARGLDVARLVRARTRLLRRERARIVVRAHRRLLAGIGW
jgi:hypothetical protein